ncbi:hypothetical protein HaGV_gp110 [Helicoverpa armigera granulovirus]|uniref:Uncharacterized protein n=1 Tax=Helicoverpa armigera granulovirus TaxID=489830 RepID=A9YMV2_9BBAC|nr:hypothetical protein HaGV_gp110 [Helicoverpa armigera granulovirus]ABY47801.1 unknown [Helicoverpa armigera granulovirus]
MSSFTILVCVSSFVVGVSFAKPNETPTILDAIAKIYNTVEEANAPTTACFEFYEHSNYLGAKTIVCGKKGQCINVPSPDTVSSIKFLNGGRFFAVQKMRIYKEENCHLYLDSDGYDPYGMSNLVWNDGYHNCDGYDLFSSSCDKSFNDNVYSFRF